ncbi:hypothetical protein [Metabacillus sp. 84]
MEIHDLLAAILRGNQVDLRKICLDVFGHEKTDEIYEFIKDTPMK